MTKQIVLKNAFRVVFNINYLKKSLIVIWLDMAKNLITCMIQYEISTVC